VKKEPSSHLQREVEKPVEDWRSYDQIAERYDRAWFARFEAVARRISMLISPETGDTVLDIGTGTGIVPRSLWRSTPPSGLTVGCDRSTGMLRQARARMTGLRVLVADAAVLPFKDESFTFVTASFVLSHVPDYPRALAETHRVLKGQGTLAASSWAPPSDPYTTAWSEWLARAISKAEVERATAEVAPWESHFSEAGHLEAAFARAGFSVVRSDVVDVELDCTVEQFIQEREFSSSGRLGRHLLGPDGWARFRAGVGEMFQSRFGRSCRYQRRALIAIGTKP
jgi:ubiquinone/menaquinone biosynthesis C-methylase UbiE